MSEAAMGTEVGALLSTRRWLMVLGTLVWTIPTLLFARYQWGNLSSSEHGLIGLAVLALSIGILFGSRRNFLWFFPLGQACFLLCAFVAPQTSPNWLPLATLASWFAYFLIALSSRNIGRFFIPIGAVVVIAAWSRRPSIVIPGPLEVLDGWVVFAQTIAAGVGLWWAWNLLVDEAHLNDERVERVEIETSRLIKLHERAVIWRAAAKRIHESVLNTLNYVLTTSSIDRARLADEIQREVAEPFVTDQIVAPAGVVVPSSVIHSQLFPTYDKARLLISAPLAAISLVGSTYFILKFWDANFLTRVGCIFGIIGVAIAVMLVLRRRRIYGLRGLLLVIAPALVPWFISQPEFACSDSALVTPIVTISGYSLMIIIAWGGVWSGLVGLVVWTIGGFSLVTHFGGACRNSMSVGLLNSMVILPIILAVAAIGARAYLRASDRAMEVRQLEVIERSRAEASAELNDQLQGAVGESVRLLNLVAAGGEVDDSMRKSLELVDGRIRSWIQVDPERNGAFVMMMRTLIEESAASGFRINVRSLVSSNDVRALPVEVVRLFQRMVQVPGEGVPLVQVFTDGLDDHMAVNVTRGQLRAAGLRPGAIRTFEDVNLQVEQESVEGVSEDLYVVVVSRPIQSDLR